MRASVRSGRGERLISKLLLVRTGRVLGIEVGIVLVSWVRRGCVGEWGEEGEEKVEKEEAKKEERLTTSSQRRTTNKSSDKPQYTKSSKIINQRSRYL